MSHRTDQILVEAESRPIYQAKLQVGDRVMVAGRCDDNSSKALTITTADRQVTCVFDD